jgi:hypothetical protein
MAGQYQREAFKGHVGSMPKSGGGASPMGGKVIGKTEIHHMEDGSHHIEHHDGEKSDHPSMVHAGVHMAAKHDGGEHGHIHAHPEGGATTHHVGMDGQVTGPDKHGSVGEAADHLSGMMGEGEMPEQGGMPSGGGAEDNEL